VAKSSGVYKAEEFGVAWAGAMKTKWQVTRWGGTARCYMRREYGGEYNRGPLYRIERGMDLHCKYK